MTERRQLFNLLGGDHEGWRNYEGRRVLGAPDNYRSEETGAM